MSPEQFYAFSISLSVIDLTHTTEESESMMRDYVNFLKDNYNGSCIELNENW
jgi:hypothetical protein